VVPPIDSYVVNGTLLQALPGHLRLSARANYFSSLQSQQRYQQTVIAATTRTRTFGTNLSGNWGANSLSTTIDRNEVFSNDTDSNVQGSLPRITFSRAEHPIGKLPIYFGSSTEFVTLIRTDKTAAVTNERGLTRSTCFHRAVPLTKLSFLTFNSSMAFRETYWTESVDNAASRVPDSIQRRYFTLGTTITGPVFTKIFNTPAARTPRSSSTSSSRRCRSTTRRRSTTLRTSSSWITRLPAWQYGGGLRPEQPVLREEAELARDPDGLALPDLQHRSRTPPPAIGAPEQRFHGPAADPSVAGRPPGARLADDGDRRRRSRDRHAGTPCAVAPTAASPRGGPRSTPGGA
jgi:hypothetical protein